VSLAVASLEERGVADVQGHVALLRAGRAGTLLVKGTPFTAAEIGALEGAAARRGFDAVCLPDRPPRPPFEPLAGGARAWQEAVASDRLWDVRAPRDDRPFFFYFSRPADFLRVADPGQGADAERGGHFDPRRLLLGLLAGSALAAFALLVLPPLAALRREPGAAPRPAALAYMALVGLAFMLVEVPLLIRLSLALGHPVLALAVVLAGLLVAGGAGSLLGARLAARTRHGLVALLPLLVAGLAWTIDGQAALLAGLATPARVGATLALLGLLGLPMGMALPAAIDRAAGHDARATPLLFGVNGAFSVLGSVLAMVLALNLGVRATLAAAAFCYLLASLLLGRVRPRWTPG
jgi:hypothetical protein